MWDEEKFFKDFAEATDRIKPDAAFVEQLKEKMNSENVVQLEMRMKKRKQIRYMAAAAVVALCVGAGGIGFSIFGGNSNVTQQNVPHAGKEEPSGEVTGKVSGTTDQVLSNVISIIEDSANMVDDEQGNSLSTQERENLVEMLKTFKKLEDSVEISSIDFTEASVYYCVGEETVKVEIVEDKYARIEDRVYALK